MLLRPRFDARKGATQSWNPSVSFGVGGVAVGDLKRRRRPQMRRPKFGNDATVAMVHDRSNGWLLGAPGAILSTEMRSASSLSGCNDGSDMAGGQKLSAPWKNTAR